MAPLPEPPGGAAMAALDPDYLARVALGVLLFAVLFPVADALVGHHGRAVARRLRAERATR